MMIQAQQVLGGSSKKGKQRQWLLDAAMFVDAQRKIEALRTQRMRVEDAERMQKVILKSKKIKPLLRRAYRHQINVVDLMNKAKRS
jgi:hypothetical protein